MKVYCNVVSLPFLPNEAVCFNDGFVPEDRILARR